MNPSTPLLRRWLLPVLLAACAFAVVGVTRAAEVIPAEPTRYFNDYALTVKPETADRLNGELENLEKQSSDQILVCIYPKMQTDSDVSDYCQHIFRAWKIGQKGKDNGAILFVFLDNHKIWIQTGRGLEGALPDATCQQIIANDITPRFKANDYDGGLTAGVEAMIQATKGEYKGTGQTDYQKQHPAGSNAGGLSAGTIIFLIILAFIILSSFRRGGGGTMFGGAGPIIFGGGLGGGFGGGGFGGGGGGGGGGSSDGGGFFSSGGGDSGGGGAGGSW